MAGFHPMFGLTAQEQARKPNAREFVGDGTPYLRVPGLRELDSGDGAVRVGPLELPESRTYQVPMNASLTEFQTLTEPFVLLDLAPDGCPVLRRNVCSNDGMWQAGVPIYVSGVWEAEAADKKAGA